MLAKLTWTALDEAGKAWTAANRPAFLPQTPAFSGQTFFWPRNLPQERYNSVEPVPKKEIPGKTQRRSNHRQCGRTSSSAESAMISLYHRAENAEGAIEQATR